jgi:hypothetical protein
VRTSVRIGRINVSGDAPPRPEPSGMGTAARCLAHARPTSAAAAARLANRGRCRLLYERVRPHRFFAESATVRLCIGGSTARRMIHRTVR